MKILQKFLKKTESVKLDINESKTLEENITEDEMKEAIKNFKNNKSPGIDGMPIELYKIYWNELKKPLLNSINYSY